MSKFVYMTFCVVVIALLHLALVDVPITEFHIAIIIFALEFVIYLLLLFWEMNENEFLTFIAITMLIAYDAYYLIKFLRTLT